MEYALVDKNNNVVQKVLNGDHRFPVHSDLKWIRCNSEVEPGWSFYADTNAFSKPVPQSDPMQIMRNQRNKKLKSSDWRMQSDYPYDNWNEIISESSFLLAPDDQEPIIELQEYLEMLKASMEKDEE